MTGHVDDPTDDDLTAAPVGAEIARRRRLAGLTGQQLGELVGWSQTRVSRFETGATAAHPADVRKLSRVLHVPEAEAAALIQRAESQRNRLTDWRAGKGGLAGRQREVGRMEVRGRTVRIFQPAVIPGLLQVSEYARAILTASQRMFAHAGGPADPAGVYEAVSARLARQQVLAEPDRRFSFVITEATLTHRLVRPEDMIAQIRRVAEVAAWPNVTVAVLTADTILDDPPIHGFELIDDRWLVIDLYNTSLTSQGRSDLRLYAELFATYERRATRDVEPVLDRHLETYLELSRSGHRRRRAAADGS